MPHGLVGAWPFALAIAKVCFHIAQLANSTGPCHMDSRQNACMLACPGNMMCAPLRSEQAFTIMRLICISQRIKPIIAGSADYKASAWQMNWLQISRFKPVLWVISVGWIWDLSHAPSACRRQKANRSQAWTNQQSVAVWQLQNI